MASTKSAINHVSGLVRYFIDLRPGEQVTSTGESTLVLIRDYLGQAASRGRTVHAAIRHSMDNWGDSIQIGWPLGRALVCAAAAVESNVAPKQSPAMSIEAVKLLECVDANREAAPFKRQCADGILLMSYASLRFSDARRLKTIDVNSDSAHGTRLACKTRKPHGIDWPWECPLMGMTGTAARIQPILDYRAARERTNGTPPSFTFPRINHLWDIESAESAPYSATRRKLSLLRTALGGPSGESYPLHSTQKSVPDYGQPDELQHP